MKKILSLLLALLMVLSVACAFAETERRCRALYGLFREDGAAEPSPKMRVYVQRD